VKDKRREQNSGKWRKRAMRTGIRDGRTKEKMVKDDEWMDGWMDG
jgi:hypothetical protein